MALGAPLAVSLAALASLLLVRGSGSTGALEEPRRLQDEPTTATVSGSVTFMANGITLEQAQNATLAVLMAKLGLGAEYLTTVSEEGPGGSVTTTPVFCNSGGPVAAPGKLVSDCLGRQTGDTCNVTCEAGYIPAMAEFLCHVDGVWRGGPDPTCTEIICDGGLPASGYDVAACTGKRVGETCNVTCMVGFYENGAEYACGSDGLFRGAGPPNCSRKLCDAATLPAASNVNASDCAGKVTLETCTLECDEHYTGSATAVNCQLDASFQGTAPTCSAKPCDVPASFAAAQYSHNCAAAAHGDSCAVACATGYTGASAAFGCSEPNLTGTLPTCVANVCNTGMPSGDGVNASDCQGIRTAETCLPFCNAGFAASTPASQLTCGPDGSLSSSTLVCARQPCGNLSSVAGFTDAALAHSCENVVLGQSCSVYCAPGYDISGQPVSLTCSAAEASGGYVDDLGNAAATPPTCNPRSCVDLGPQLGITHNCTGKTTGETCEAAASAGYIYSSGNSSTTFVCGTQQVFVGSFPSVEPATCGTGSFGVGSQSSCTDKTIGQTCWAYCGAGYTGGPNQYNCQLDGGGNPAYVAVTTSISCTPTRRLAEIPEVESVACDASLDALGLSHFSIRHDCLGKGPHGVCLAECAEGFVLQGAPIVYRCERGSFVGSGRPICRAQQCSRNLPEGEGVTHDCRVVKPGTGCVASCLAGFSYSPEGSGAQPFMCQETGELVGTNPRCRPTPCAAPALPEHYDQTACEGKVAGESCRISCREGWALQGLEQALHCLPNGTFAGSPPQCTPVSCSRALSLADARLDLSQCGGLRPGGSCTVACAAGYEGASSIFSCSRAGALEGPRPACKQLSCAGVPPEGSELLHNCSHLLPGQRCRAACKSGYGEPEELACLRNSSVAVLTGSWPDCEEVLLPPSPEEVLQAQATSRRLSQAPLAYVMALDATWTINYTFVVPAAQAAALQAAVDSITPSNFASSLLDKLVDLGANTTLLANGFFFVNLDLPSAAAILSASRASRCSPQPAGVCTQDASELCFYDESCSQTPPWHGGLGCNAGGVGQNCRFCGFKHYLPCNLDRANYQLPCGHSPAGTCTHPGELCYFDAMCSQLPPGLEGLGCNAGGVGQNCRFCGFGVYPPCPPVIT